MSSTGLVSPSLLDSTDSPFESKKGLPKLSHLVQQEFYRALRALHIYELQDFNMKAAIEYSRDLLRIDEIEFDKWFKNRIEEVNEESTQIKYYKVTSSGEIRETQHLNSLVSSSMPILN